VSRNRSGSSRQTFIKKKQKILKVITFGLFFSFQYKSDTNDYLSEAIEFLREFDREASDMCNRVANNEWKYSTNTTEYNKRKMREQQSLAAKFECLSWRRAAAFDSSKILDANIRRQLGRIVQQGRCGLDDRKYQEVG
jgi:peptidyl-dipeptidase A